jgi:hypothetical protein
MEVCCPVCLALKCTKMQKNPGHSFVVWLSYRKQVARSSDLGFPSIKTMCALFCCFVQDFGATWLNLTANSNGRIASFRDFDWGAQLDK